MIADPPHLRSFQRPLHLPRRCRRRFAPYPEELYARGFRTFLSGMAVGSTSRPPKRCWAAAAGDPMSGWSPRFPSGDRRPASRRPTANASGGCWPPPMPSRYSLRSITGVLRRPQRFSGRSRRVLVAWYDGSPGPRYTVRRARGRGLEILDLHPAAPALSAPAPTLFG